MHYVYFIKSESYNENYIGSTNDLHRRLAEHNSGMEASTKRYKPWQLVYYEAYLSEKDAREREMKLKNHGNAIRELKKRIQQSLKNGKGSPSTTFFSKKNGAGFTLIETMIAVVVIGIAFLGLLAVVTGVFTHATRDEVVTIATMLAKGEMERASGLGWSVADDSGSFSGNFSDYSWQIRVDAVPIAIADDAAMANYKQVEARVTNAITGDVNLKMIVTNY